MSARIDGGFPDVPIDLAAALRPARRRDLMAASLDDAAFRRRSDEALAAVARWLSDFDPDELDFDEADGVLTLEFADGTRFVLNRQAGSRQLWYAAGARAWHYGWDAERGWLDDRDGHELASNLVGTVSDKIGRRAPEPGPLHAR